ncbi:hypothetical protein KKG72_03835 [bacterium]|nr:hypothetical protein [bacterium]MBU1995303.1 hypothetical protein [bacterium]
MNPLEHNNQSMQMIEEDEIDLRELWQTILKGKKLILIFTMLVTVFTIIFALKQPNVYQSQAVLIPTEADTSSLAGLGGLAAMAGVSLGGSSMTPDIAFESLLNNYEFMKSFIENNKILEYYENKELDKNYVFALGYRGIYDLFQFDKEEEEDKDERIYELMELIQKNFSISSDKKTSLVTISYSDYDKSYAPKMVYAFLEDSSKYLVENDLKNINNSLKYFQEELSNADSIELRQNLSSLISNILQKKVMSKSKKYYQCDALTLPFEAYVKDKIKPKRALIVVVGFVTGLILSIFLVFFLAFIRNEQDSKITP